jgi:DNA-directed RNA polymerase subunit RPC12/RpoP
MVINKFADMKIKDIKCGDCQSKVNFYGECQNGKIIVFYICIKCGVRENIIVSDWEKIK